jgi:hypothetical protein
VKSRHNGSDEQIFGAEASPARALQRLKGAKLTPAPENMMKTLAAILLAVAIPLALPVINANAQNADELRAQREAAQKQY